MWLWENLGTAVTAAVLALIIGLIVAKMVRDRKQGKSSCGCGCSTCPMSGSCHTRRPGSLKKDPGHS